MENNQNTIKPGMNSESKAKFFAQYMFQRVLMWHDQSILYAVDGSDIAVVSTKKTQYFLLLTPLSDITDEQLIECCKYKNEMSFITRKSWRVERKDHYALISSRISSHSFAVDFVSGDVEFYNDDEIEVTISDTTKDYLRSIGAACPFMGYSVEDMVQAGWIKLKGGK